MNKLLLIPLLFAAPVRAGDEESLRTEIDLLQSRLVVAEDRIARLETMTSLLMATYSLKVKEQSELEQREHRPPAPILDQPPTPPSMVSP
jgi:hypothetical protein